MAILTNEQLMKRLTKLETEVGKALKDHEDKINSLETETIGSLRLQLQKLAKRVHDLEQVLKDAGIILRVT
jgi:oligoendopeptidase F